MALSFVPSAFFPQPGEAGLPGHFPVATAAKVASPLQLTVAMTTVKRDPVAGEIIDAAIEVHRLLGPGLLESAYQGCLVYELTSRGLRVARQVALPVTFRGA